MQLVNQAIEIGQQNLDTIKAERDEEAQKFLIAFEQAEQNNSIAELATVDEPLQGARQSAPRVRYDPGVSYLRNRFKSGVA